MKKKTVRPTSNAYVSTSVLRKVAALMLPFYKKVAGSRSYAYRWSKAVREADLGKMEIMFRSVVPQEPIVSLSVNGIGYFIDFPLPKPIYAYTNATSLRPGTTQFTFDGRIFRAIAKAVLPFYREMIGNRHYTAMIVKAIQSRDQAFLERLIRSKITTKSLKSIKTEYSGFFLGFRYASSKYVYYHEMFRELPL